MDDAFDVGPRCIDGRMEREAGLVGSKGRAAKVKDVPTHVDLHQTRGRYLMMHHAVWCNEEVLKILTDSSLEQEKLREY